VIGCRSWVPHPHPEQESSDIETPVASVTADISSRRHAETSAPCRRCSPCLPRRPGRAGRHRGLHPTGPHLATTGVATLRTRSGHVSFMDGRTTVLAHPRQHVRGVGVLKHLTRIRRRPRAPKTTRESRFDDTITVSEDVSRQGFTASTVAPESVLRRSCPAAGWGVMSFATPSSAVTTRLSPIFSTRISLASLPSPGSAAPATDAPASGAQMECADGHGHDADASGCHQCPFSKHLSVSALVGSHARSSGASAYVVTQIGATVVRFRTAFDVADVVYRVDRVAARPPSA
jgi:hypothetical protein